MYAGFEQTLDLTRDPHQRYDDFGARDLWWYCAGLLTYLWRQVSVVFSSDQGRCPPDVGVVFSMSSRIARLPWVIGQLW